jgi:hypothetical protein
MNVRLEPDIEFKGPLVPSLVVIVLLRGPLGLGVKKEHIPRCVPTQCVIVRCLCDSRKF